MTTPVILTMTHTGFNGALPCAGQQLGPAGTDGHATPPCHFLKPPSRSSARGPIPPPPKKKRDFIIWWVGVMCGLKSWFTIFETGSLNQRFPISIIMRGSWKFRKTGFLEEIGASLLTLVHTVLASQFSRSELRLCGPRNPPKAGPSSAAHLEIPRKIWMYSGCLEAADLSDVWKRSAGVGCCNQSLSGNKAGEREGGFITDLVNQILINVGSQKTFKLHNNIPNKTRPIGGFFLSSGRGLIQEAGWEYSVKQILTNIAQKTHTMNR